MRLEAVLLLAKTPLTTRKLAQLAHLADGTEARTLVRQLNRTYETYGRALRVEQVAGGYRLLTRPSLAPWLVRLGHLPPALRLSTPMMETLAVVAYRQPVSRADAEAVRGVACGELLRQLMERDLIRIAGRGEELGRPYLYGTTKRFLQLFGLPSADDLPPIRWQTLHEDQLDPDDDLAETAPHDSPQEVISTSPKESVVSTVVAPSLAETDPEIQSTTGTLAPQSDVLLDDDPRAEIDEVEWDDDEDDADDDDDDDDDWDDEEDEDWDDDEDDDLDEDDDELVDDDEDDDEWEEVDDEDDDEDWDDEEDDDEEDDVDEADDVDEVDAEEADDVDHADADADEEWDDEEEDDDDEEDWV